jgi:hypothetical protein
VDALRDQTLFKKMDQIYNSWQLGVSSYLITQYAATINTTLRLSPKNSNLKTTLDLVPNFQTVDLTTFPLFCPQFSNS